MGLKKKGGEWYNQKEIVTRRKSGKVGKRRRKKKMTNKKKMMIMGIAGGTILVIALAYMGAAIFFTRHFLMNTEINGVDFSGKSLAEAEEYFKGQVGEYTLIMNDINGGKETISSSEILLAYGENTELEGVLEEQNAFLWPKAFFTENTADITFNLSYDEAKLQEKINTLGIIQAGQTPAQNASPTFDGNQFVVSPEAYGVSVTPESLQEKASTFIMHLMPEMNLADEGCYEAPRFLSDSEEVKQACDKMNGYCQASITYNMDVPVVIDRTVISTWLSVDGDMNVIVDENAVRAWLEQFGERYDTVGTTRTFTTPTGKSATVSGGTYGWSINEDTEFQTIMNALNNQEVIAKEPEYYISGVAASHSMPDWGSTYAEVDLSAQHMWYVVNGSVALETDVVTGEPIPEKVTPEGVYSIVEKKLDKVLVGAKDPVTGEPEYETPVSYWMRITWQGVGFHDATWQRNFGGALNQIRGIGSHGCVNMPLDKAAELYNMIEMGTPVIIHY